MRHLRPLLLCLAIPGFALSASVEMPEWAEPTESERFALGGGLFPVGLLPNQPDGEEEDDATVAEASNSENDSTVPQPNPTRFYGPVLDTEEGATEAAGEDAAGSQEVAKTDEADVVEEEILEEEVVAYEPLPPIEGELEDLYFAYKPVDYLIDPQRLLTEQKSNDIKRFLEFHSDESNFHIYVMVVGETQTIPEDVNLNALHKEWFSDQPTVMMLYYREQPERTEFVFSEKVRSALPTSVFERIGQYCLREGAATDDAPDQVEKMAIELSIQLYWLTRLADAEGSEAKEKVASSELHEMPASEDAPELLREYVPGIFVEDSGQWVPFVVTVLLVLAGICLFGFFGWLALWWRSREKVPGKPLIFPNFDVVPRLGGEYSGGSFVGMSFDISDHTSH